MKTWRIWVPAASARDINWKVPEGWQERAPSSVRVGSFLAKGPGGGKADIYLETELADAKPSEPQFGPDGEPLPITTKKIAAQTLAVVRQRILLI